MEDLKLSTTFRCDNCGGPLANATAECPTCASDLPAVSPLKRPKTSKAFVFPYGGTSLFLILVAWSVMLGGSALASMEMVGSLELFSARTPAIPGQIIYHRVGFYLAVLALALGGIALVKKSSSWVTRVAFLLSMLYVLPRLLIHG